MKKLVQVAICFFFLVRLDAQQPPPKGPEVNPPLSLPSSALLDNSEWTQIQDIHSEATKLLAAKDYAGLEKAADTVRATGRPASGTPPITFFYDALVKPSEETDAAYQERLATLSDWAKADPGSVTSRIALGKLMTSYAWFARGSGYAGTVTDQGWSLFGKRLQQAESFMDGVKDQRTKYPEWYGGMSRIALGEGWKPEDFLALMNEGVLIDPKASKLPSDVCTYLLPRWYGSNEQLLDYATAAADRVGGDDGDVLYARIAQGVLPYGGGVEIFKDVGFSWPRVRHGMEIICTQYPQSTFMANWFCRLARSAEDKATCQVLLDHLGSHATDEFTLGSVPVWEDEGFLTETKAWAASQ
jgi:hypothetical protein